MIGRDVDIIKPLGKNPVDRGIFMIVLVSLTR